MNRQDIFFEDVDRRFFLRILENTASECGAEVLAYCLMNNHIHLALKVAKVPLSVIMQRVLTAYSRYFNRRYGRVGHLFQDRYYPVLCLHDAYLAACIRYIHWNPVKAGLAKSPLDWPWSSAAWFGPQSGEGLDEFDPWKVPDCAAKLLRIDAIDRKSLDDLGREWSMQSKMSVEALWGKINVAMLSPPSGLSR